MKTCKSLLSAFIVISILCLSLGVTAATEVDSGSCGTNVYWSLDSDGVLTISGEGGITSSWRHDSRVKSVIIEEGITSIGDGAFYDCFKLTSITIPEGVTSIGEYVFYYCESLASVTIPEGVTSIGEDAFIGCESLKKVYAASIESWCNIQFANYGSNPTHNGAYLYFNNTLAQNITIPNTVTAINNYAFSGCDSLTSVTIPEGVTSIGNSAFSCCYSLTSITIPEGATSIGDEAFYDCYSLTTVTLPSTIESIDDYAFSGCSKITDVYYYGTEAEWDNNVYVGGNNDNLKNAQFHYMKVVQTDGISLDKTELSLLVGEAGVITAAVSPYNSTSKSVSWASSDESVATVSASGTVTAVGAGTATITATTAVGGFSASCTVTVTEPIKQGYKVNSITIKDGKGNKLSKIPANSFLATVSITNIDADSETVLVLARYKKNGAFAKLLYVTVDEMPVGSTIKFTMPIDNPDGTVYKLKAFCWEDFTSAKPIGEAVTVY